MFNKTGIYDLSYAEESDNGSEECDTLDKGGSNNHVGEQLVHYFGLACHGIHSLTADFADTYTCTDCCETCAYSGAKFCDAFNG